MTFGRIAAGLLLGSLLGACRSAPPASFSPAPAPQTTQSDSTEQRATNDRETTGREVTHRFYADRPYGSELQFNPLSLVINGGYDQLRTGENRNVFRLPYRAAFHTVWHSVTDPEPVLRHYGWGNWVTHEVFPLSLKRSGGGQWYPNYHLHLFAGGMTYARTVEWYEQHGANHPELAAGATVYTWHLLTEMVESNGVCCEDEDGLTDLLIFDAGSIILWNQSWVKRLFDGERVEFTDWPGQPTLSLPSRRLENAYMMAMLRAPLPHATNWKIMTTMGNAFLVGVSRRVGSGLWLSTSVGFDPADNPVIDPKTGAKTATVLPNAGFFLDRHSSLLVSLITKGGSSNGPTLNIYPGVIGSGVWSPGVWAQSVRGGGFRFGVVSRYGVGVGGMGR